VFAGLAASVLTIAGCGRNSPSKSEIRAVTTEVLGAAEQATDHQTQITIRPEIHLTPAGAKNPLVEDTIYISLSDRSQVGVLRQNLQAIAQRYKLSVEETATGEVTRFDFTRNGVRTHTIDLIMPLPARSALPARAPEGGPELAIIVDDLGHDPAAADALLALSFPITVSVLPNLPLSTQVAEEAYHRGDQVMLHLPMESQGESLEGAVPEAAELRVGMSSREVASTVDGMLETVPHARGVNNHQGSRATADPALMQTLMPLLRERHLFFIDSRTTALTVAYDAAETSGVRSASRKVFLDDTVTRDAVLAQLDLAARDAMRDGSAIAIGHPHPATIRALSEGVPRIEARGIRLVFASDLVR
jgi:uncharacterized protein